MTARRIRPGVLADPGAALAALGAVVSPDLDAYASGDLPLSRVRCALCGLAPCQCPPFGTPEYLALTDRRHGRARRRPRPCQCGAHILPCDCGGQACPGWHHEGRTGGHWCRDGSKAAPAPEVTP